MLKERKVSDKDAENLAQAVTLLGYDVCFETEQTGQQMHYLLNSAIQKEIKRAHSSIAWWFIFFLTAVRKESMELIMV